MTYSSVRQFPPSGTAAAAMLGAVKSGPGVFVLLREGQRETPDVDTETAELGNISLSLEDTYAGTASAVIDGNVELYNLEFKRHQETFAKNNTVVLLTTVKLVVYWSLVRRMQRMIGESIGQGEGQQPHQQPLEPYFEVFGEYDRASEAEALSVLANLMHIGAVNGYVAWGPQKVVFAKDRDRAFPRPGTWGMWQ